MRTIYWDDPKAVRRLGNAIVTLACDDYLMLIREMHDTERLDKRLRKNKKHGLYVRGHAFHHLEDYMLYANAELREIERFFRSRLFGVITDIDPDYLMEQLRKLAMDPNGLEKHAQEIRQPKSRF